MRWVVVHPGPSASVADVHAGWVEALRAAGQHVVTFPLDALLTFYDSAYLRVDEHSIRKACTSEQAVTLAADRIYATLYKNHPDVLLVVSAFLVPPELLDLARFRGTKVVVLHTESPYEDQRQINMAAHADLNIVNDPVNLAAFQHFASSHYLPHAHRPHLHRPGDPVPDLVCDFAFVGTGFESRIAFFEAMHATGGFDGLRVRLRGNWRRLPDDSVLRKWTSGDPAEFVDNTDAVHLYRSARIGLNLYRREGENDAPMRGWAMSPREVEMAATGLFFLRDPRPEGDEVLSMLPTFTDAGDAGDQLRWWLAHDGARSDVARKAREAVAPRTFDANAASLLRLLEKE